MLQAGSIVGSFLAFIVSDLLGRKKTSQMACILWIIGSVVWFTSVHGHSGDGNLSQLLAGRFIAGLGVGMTPVCAPTYLVEIAPRAIRGLAVCIFSASVYIGILLGYWVNYGTSLHISDTNSLQWQAPASLNFVVAGLIFIGCFFIPESPRWLLKVGRREQARKSLYWLRNCGDNDAVVVNEFETICEQLDKEAEARGNRAWYHIFWQMLRTPRNLHILAIGVGIQVFGQFSGGGSMTVFAPKLFGYVSAKTTWPRYNEPADNLSHLASAGRNFRQRDEALHHGHLWSRQAHFIHGRRLLHHRSGRTQDRRHGGSLASGLLLALPLHLPQVQLQRRRYDRDKGPEDGK